MAPSMRCGLHTSGHFHPQRRIFRYRLALSGYGSVRGCPSRDGRILEMSSKGVGAKAVVYQEPYKVTVEEMPDPQIEAPNDAVVRMTTTNICGSDVHVYEGRTPAEPGFIFGHENQGIVEEVGAGVTRVEVGEPPQDAGESPARGAEVAAQRGLRRDLAQPSAGPAQDGARYPARRAAEDPGARLLRGPHARRDIQPPRPAARDGEGPGAPRAHEVA